MDRQVGSGTPPWRLFYTRRSTRIVRILRMAGSPGIGQAGLRLFHAHHEAFDVVLLRDRNELVDDAADEMVLQ